MIPVIALVGRPNVGKSTLFNRLTRSRDALVADLPGLTRDRKYGEFSALERRCILIDTGALGECDLALLMVDARAGLTPVDREVLDRVRASGKPYVLVVNKIDGIDE